MEPVALVTGGGRGIGAATARELARRGYRVVVNYHRDRASAEAVAAETGGTAIRADVRDPAEVAALVAACGPVTALVCNANIDPSFGPVRSLPWEAFIAKVEGELAAAYHVTQAVLPDMPEHGRIVYVSSLSADLTRPMTGAHTTAKAALDAFARHVAAEASPVAVNVVAPAAVRTEGSSAARTPEVEAALAGRSVLGRMVEPDDVAAVIAAVADGSLPAVAGARIPVDAGFRVLAAP
ncbi:Cyclic-di-GMP-binding biofilm dispersal mediator protein [Actinomadura sp. RB99]|uniref:SDR family oxidoreductase n=1 Tax=Actinomadura sp. RB99 TaxID=2691577 RepID=UPI001687A68B|nr:SDR family oxidoreductase [Actinomadura sp. RB99]MBD2897574.1 Cyclic-di-GMP-binding biofilm dispersal mediator protein [Actinomadura sp. RB99]